MELPAAGGKPIHVKEITGREPDAENDDTPKADPFLP